MSITDFATELLTVLRDSCVNQKENLSTRLAESLEDHYRQFGVNQGLHLALSVVSAIADKFLGDEFVKVLGINRNAPTTVNTESSTVVHDGEIIPPSAH